MTEKEVWLVEFGPDFGGGHCFVNATETEMIDYLKSLVTKKLKEVQENGCECDPTEDVPFKKKGNSLVAFGYAWYNHEYGGVQDQYCFDVRATRMKDIDVQEPNLEQQKTSSVRKHVELDQSTIKDVLWKVERLKRPMLIPGIEKSLKKAVEKNPLVSYVGFSSVCLSRPFYTLFDGEVVGKFIVNFRNDDVTFLHNGNEYVVPWSTEQDGMKAFQHAIEAYAGGYEEFENFLAKHHL